MACTDLEITSYSTLGIQLLIFHTAWSSKLSHYLSNFNDNFSRYSKRKFATDNVLLIK